MTLNATENFTPDRLFAGDYDVVTSQGTLVTGQNLKRGALLGLVTATGKYSQCNSANVDGTQTPVAILAVDCDATLADKTIPIYLSG